MKNIIKATSVFSKMAQEFSCGAIVFRKDTEPLYLLLNYSKGILKKADAFLAKAKV